MCYPYPNKGKVLDNLPFYLNRFQVFYEILLLKVKKIINLNKENWKLLFKMSIPQMNPCMLKFGKDLLLMKNMQVQPYSGWNFWGLLTDRGGGTKRPPNLKSVTHILQ